MVVKLVDYSLDLSFSQLKDVYNSRKPLCEKGYSGYVYHYSSDRLSRLPCSSYSCKACRPKLKRQLHDDVCQLVDSNNLSYHMVVTFPGNDLRRILDYSDSYFFMSYDWNKLRLVLKYKYPDFKYILFPRAQADPKPGNPAGFCHYHIIHNTHIDKDWLDSKTKKYTLGYTFLRHNEDVAGYLHNDFYVDDEWVIPFGLKHYRATRDLIVRPGQGYMMDQDSIAFPKGTTLSRVEDIILSKYGRLLPFDEYLKLFSDLNM